MIDSLLVVESKLGIQNGEHALIQGCKEMIHGFFQIEFTACVVVFQIAEEIGKDFAILFVQDAVCSFKHVVKVSFRVFQQLTKEF